MKHLNVKFAAIAMFAASILTPFDADAAAFDFSDNSYIAKMRQKAKPVRPFRGNKPWDVQTAWQNAGLNAKLSHNDQVRKVAVSEPVAGFEGLSYYDYLEAPDGSTWFYTTEYDIEKIEHSEWYTEEYMLGYTFTIYDSSFKEVGKIKDKIRLAEGETGARTAVLDPSVSTTFFNDDSKIEVMVYLAMNTVNYDMHYYNKVYSIGGEKDGEGNDVCIATMPGRCVDTFNAAAGTGAEDFYYTFVEDIYPNPDDYGFDQYLDYINNAKTHVSVYSKSADAKGYALAYEKDIYMTRYPGDTTDGIYLITKTVNGTPYFIFSQYEKPYFVDPTGFATDESATKDNSLVIETYSYSNNKMDLVSTTKIPVEIQEIIGEINYTFYSIGSVAWQGDVDMSVNGTPQAPAYLVARDFTKASNLEEVESSYDIYGNDGKLIRTLAKNTDGIAILNSAIDEEPHALFVNKDANDQYTFRFVDLYSGKTVLSLPQDNNGDPISASCQRVADKSGNYKYAFVMQYYSEDADGNDNVRVAWFNTDGKLDHIDKINVGKDVMAATINMYAESLSPYIYDNDDAMEYAALVKRMSGNTTKNEFIVVDDNGDWYAHFTDADGKGTPFVFTILPGAETNRLQMVYSENRTYNIEIYDLPFDNTPSSVKDVAVGNANPTIFFDGSAVSAQGKYIEVYNATGAMVAAGNNSVSLESLAHSIYIAVARDAQGRSTILKIVR